MTFIQRSYLQELLDAEEVPFADVERNMQELNTINTLLGGHTITIKGIKQLIGNLKEIHVCEIGCGGGDNLMAINTYCEQHHIKVHFAGIDIKQSCIDFAATKTTLQQNTDWIVSDYQQVYFTSKPDIIFSSLFCHHFTDEQLTAQLQWMQENSKLGFFINDLERNCLAYYAIKFITKIFSRSYLVKNDAPLSVLRGFTRQEWGSLFAKAGIKKYRATWQWAFRYLIIYKK